MSLRKISTIFALLLILVLLPAGSYYFMKVGYKYRKDSMSELKKLGEVPEFNFTSHRGEPITRDSLKGKMVVVDFFFSRCGGPCPEMARQLKRVEDAFDDRTDIVILSHTVDPEYDTPEVLNKYAKGVGVGDDWHFLTGSKAEIYKQARQGYKIAADEGEGGPDDFIHSEKLVLIDSKYQIRSYYDGTDSSSVNRLIEHIAMIMPQNKKGALETQHKEEL